MVLIAASEGRGRDLAQVAAGLELPAPAIALPGWDCRPGDGSGPSRAVVGRRAAVLAMLAPGRPLVLVTTVAATLQLLPPADRWPSRPLEIAPGDAAEVEAWRVWLDAAGYILDQRIDEPGEAAIRGAVVEIFPSDARVPVRIELAHGEVAALRRYDPLSQRSTDTIDRLAVLPASELVLDAATRAHLLAEAQERGLAPEPVAAALTTGRGRELASTFLPLAFPHLESIPSRLPEAVLVLESGSEAALQDRFEEMAEVREAGTTMLGRAGELDLLYRSAQHALFLGEQDWREVLATHPVIALEGTAVEPQSPRRRDARAQGADPAPSLPFLPAEIAPGDHVVHAEHGMARVLGLETIDQENGDEDFLALEFAGEKRLLVPSAELDRIWRYGSADSGVRLDVLGNGSWAGRRAAIETEIRQVATRIVRQARRRTRTKAPVIEADGRRMSAVRRRFGFEETAAQQAAIEAVLADLASGRPMDRLVCGDVGYGKTEVAIRAAAAVAFSGRQVAILAPTTVLARQHFTSFTRRFAGLGAETALVIGGQKRSEADQARALIADGAVAIAIGTHALLSKAVRFDDLALVIVDEEQRFGARHKSALQSLARGRHALAMSATPIPRTLQAALAGLRDLSVIDTPPFRRRPVRTVLTDADPTLVRSALRREAKRGGQSFCIVPRVADIERIATEVKELVPDLALVTAHGRLKAAALDRAMLAFAGGEADVLIATAIVESGIDIPRANTMLVWRPDLFGLGQLHQLRGRVGRGAAQAYAYLLTDPGHALAESTATRLRAVEAIESLGGGFTASMLDLDRRGAGELTGEEQSGHLTEIGTELYQHLLARALRAASGQRANATLPEIRLDVPIAVPQSYVPETELRIGLHRRIARAADRGELTELEAEIRDRFGPLPASVAALITVAGLRFQARDLGLAELRAGPAAVVLRFADARAAGTAAKRLGGEDRGEGRVRVQASSSGVDDRLRLVADLLARLDDDPSIAAP